MSSVRLGMWQKPNRTNNRNLRHPWMLYIFSLCARQINRHTITKSCEGVLLFFYALWIKYFYLMSSLLANTVAISVYKGAEYSDFSKRQVWMDYSAIVKKHTMYMFDKKEHLLGPILHPAQLTLSKTPVSFLVYTRRTADSSLHRRTSVN